MSYPRFIRSGYHLYRHTIDNIRVRIPACQRIEERKLRQRAMDAWLANGPAKTGNGKTYVVLNHHYDLDIEALAQADTDNELWSANFDLFEGVRYFFPECHRHINCVYGEGSMKKTLDRYREQFVRPFVRRVMTEIKPDGLITTSDIFYWFRPILQEFQRQGVPAIVQDKEGTLVLNAPWMRDHANHVKSKYPPCSDRYYFWSKTQEKWYGWLGLSPELGEVVGQPRSDFFFHSNRWPSRQSLDLPQAGPVVVAFTFDSTAYTGQGNSSNPASALPQPWKAMRTEMHDSLCAIAAENPQGKVVVKAHPQSRELAEIGDELGGYGQPNLCMIAGKATASHLIVNADVIVGFQTTALIEAMLTDKPIIYVGWSDEARTAESQLLQISASGGCLVAQNQAHLDELLRAALRGELVPDADMMSRRAEFTDQFFYQADGHVCERFLSSVDRFVDSLADRWPLDRRLVLDRAGTPAYAPAEHSLSQATDLRPR